MVAPVTTKSSAATELMMTKSLQAMLVMIGSKQVTTGMMNSISMATTHRAMETTAIMQKTMALRKMNIKPQEMMLSTEVVTDTETSTSGVAMAMTYFTQVMT